MISVTRRVGKYLLEETRTWGGLIGFITAFFILVTAVTNALYGVFDLQLLPVFENTLLHLRKFIHLLFELLMFHPLEIIANFAVDLFAFDITIPSLVPPPWYLDFVLISMILSRAERAAMKMSMPVKHDEPKPQSSIVKISWGVVLFFYVPTKWLLAPINRFAPAKVYSAGRIFLDGVTWLGFWFLIHDILIVRNNWKLDDEESQSHRAFVTYLVFSLFAALVASALFFVMNGYLHDRFLNEAVT